MSSLSIRFPFKGAKRSFQNATIATSNNKFERGIRLGEIHLDPTEQKNAL
ncbi:MAG: hypothetical protein COC00_006680 [Rhizobiales bacterium]|nr:hypothetical protein [Hyphomicrobiales bacterium]